MKLSPQTPSACSKIRNWPPPSQAARAKSAANTRGRKSKGNGWRSIARWRVMNRTLMSDRIRKLERAERDHGERRASLKQSSDLRVPLRIFRRYQAPPADTPFAIEYAYNLLGDVNGKNVLELGCG